MYYTFRVRVTDEKTSIVSIFYHDARCEDAKELSKKMKALQEQYRDDTKMLCVTYREATDYDYG